ncbi:hypothetical protein CDD81_5840 [Ophiocordyceps australis]|uniref:Zn(2)-C6 fungal-type domain-containing protein n=1 Tax=Ophiocordyceps australis TaxID=1399860 RepID=A0A2C5Y9A7_9HYPO|nr:hypothetical protein CDD81_5840 [Ophiocordyceps australis]
MGDIAAFEYRQRLPPPDSPPELASPGASSYSSRSSPLTEQAWVHRAPAPLLMSSYGKGSTVDSSADKHHDAHESLTGQASASRQQLPSLSSLFGPPSTMRSLRSPSDRDSSYLSQSPLDRARASPSIASGSLAYFPQTASPPVSQPRSTYDVKFDPERQSLHAFARAFSGPRSPSHREQPMHARLDPRPDAEASASTRWVAAHPDGPRHEYALGAREALYSSPGDKVRNQLPRPRESASEYSDHRAVTGGQPQTPTGSAVSSDGMPSSKDGLGPKIWTGTHFLPRFVRAAEVPGEGLCYFYDDGSHCKTVIDGEQVNAHWGVTKAGKPRKRLAIACVTCREKKIKCDPDYPRCVQCEKFGRVCKFKNAPRGGHNTSPSTSPVELDDVRKAGPSSRALDSRASECGSSPPLSPRTNLRRPASPDASFSKRLKVGHDAYVPNGEASAIMSRPLDHSKMQPPMLRPPVELPRIPEEDLSRASRTDPYGSDPDSISAVLTHFFGQIDNTMIMRFFPEKIFRSWVASSARGKSPEDLMVLYSVLAIGVALSGGLKRIAYEYAQVAHYAQRTLAAVPCLQLVQSRVLLAVYYISISRLREANELISSAAATAVALQLNREFDPSREESMAAYPFGMNSVGYCEARRRTLWSLFMLERLNGVFPERPTMINADDIYVRLPADSESFEKQMEASMPLFDPDESTVSKLAEKPSDITGYLVEMTHIWSNCQSAISRLASRAAPSDTDHARARMIATRADEWHNSLPSRLVWGASNLESAAFSGKVGSFLTMHLLYRHAMIRLNRHHVSVARMSPESRAGHLQECREHALSILDMTSCLDRILRVRPTILSTSPPAMSVTVTTAIDVLTASGPMASINELIQSIRVAKTAVDNVAKSWEPSLAARDAIDHRLHKLTQIYHSQGSRPTSPREGYRVISSAGDSRHCRWHISDRIEHLYPLDMDIVYATFV